MRKVSLLVTALIFAITASLYAEGNKAKDTYKVDAEKSTVKWTAKSAKGGHFGKVQAASGNFQFDGKSITAGTIVINMTSISVDDIEDPGRKERLANHLKNDDFFSADKFPESKLEITSSKPGKKAGELEVTGNLTIKGITNPITFPVTLKSSGKNLEAEGSMVVDRIQYGIKFRSKSVLDPSALADRLIYDEFTLDFKVSASK